MIDISFSAEQQDELFEEFRQGKNGNLRVRFLALYLKSQGLSHGAIGEICRISRPTLASYLKYWKEGGKARLVAVEFHRPGSKLMEFSEELKTHFEANPPQTINEAKEEIKAITGISRSPTQVGVFLKAIGMKVRKVGFIPGKASTAEKQAEQDGFKKNAGTLAGDG